jgi:DNA polymerase-1
MHHILFGSDTSDLQVAILIKTTALNKVKLERHYLSESILPAKSFIAFDLFYNDKNKCPAKEAKLHLKELLREVDELAITTILVCDAAYFKYVTKEKKADPHYGYVLPCAIGGYAHINVILCPNYQAMMYNPNLQEKVDMALDTLDRHLQGNYEAPGKDIIHTSAYPSKIREIEDALEDLHKYPELTCDIEARSLEFWNCGISSIAFAWDKHNGIAFGVDRGPGIDESSYRQPIEQGFVRTALKKFFVEYQGKLIWHNISYDGKVLVYQLFMEYLSDYPRMIEGIKVSTKNFDDTKLIAYMATNNAVQNVLGLKPLSGEFTGNYAEDTKNTDLIPLDELLIYNLKDCLATWYVKEKYEPIMIEDDQQDLYEGLMKDSVKTLMQTELCGMPINPGKVQECKSTLQAIVDRCDAFFFGSPIIKAFHEQEKQALADNLTDKAKKKVYAIDDPIVERFAFNPGSDTQLRKLLYDYLGLPVVDLTKGKQPATGGKTIKKLMNHTADPAILEIFKYLQKRADASIILSTFIPAFENAQQLPDGSWRLYGNFNLGGSQSLRLSSSNPNLQNLPSSSAFAKIVKECFMPDPDWIFGGADFDSLEDRINALLTRDQNKLKVYTDGFDGHCLRAQSYWPEDMPDINPTSVESINSIEDKYPNHRQNSKAPTFALTYQGTYVTLMNNCGFPEHEAKSIEEKYHTLYRESDAWTANTIEEAKNTGYIRLAFGGRIRTPLLAKTVGNGRSVPYAAKAEARSAGNAATQSYCVLTLRAFNEFLQRVWESPYVYDVLPSGTVHDSIYILFRNSVKVTKWVNDNLLDCMAWQDLEELKHPTIRISASLEIYWPSWKSKVKIPNNASKQEIKGICADAEKEYNKVLNSA